MNFLEVIQVRTLMDMGDKIGGILVDEVRRKITSYRNLLRVALLKSLQNASDFSILLEWRGEDDNFKGTPLGCQLAGSLREIGMVEHSTWKEAQ